MKRKMIAILAAALLVAMLCGQAMATSGDLTIKAVKAYSDSARTNYVGTIPAYTSLLVRSYDSFADVYVNGRLCYIDASALLHTSASSNYLATLKKGTKVYQRAHSSANSIKLGKKASVELWAVNDNWALVRSTGSKRMYAFVKVSKLYNIRRG